MVNVAQLVEHQIVALVVVGSIPTIHPKVCRYLYDFRLHSYYSWAFTINEFCHLSFENYYWHRLGWPWPLKNI